MTCMHGAGFFFLVIKTCQIELVKKKTSNYSKRVNYLLVFGGEKSDLFGICLLLLGSLEKS